ncbi:hypothetical protein ACWEKT_03195 [Nocardia takedensis]
MHEHHGMTPVSAARAVERIQAAQVLTALDSTTVISPIGDPFGGARAPRLPVTPVKNHSEQTPTMPPSQPGVTTGPTQPGVTPPTQPGVTSPGPTQPGVTTPRPTQPGVTTPGPTQPGVTTPGPTQPGVTTPGPTQPGVTTPPPSQPGVTTPRRDQPGVIPPSQPGVTTPRQPGPSQPGVTTDDQPPAPPKPLFDAEFQMPEGLPENVPWQHTTSMGWVENVIVAGTAGQTVDTTITDQDRRVVARIRRVADGEGGFTFWVDANGYLSVLYPYGTNGAEPGHSRAYSMPAGSDPTVPTIVADVFDGGESTLYQGVDQNGDPFVAQARMFDNRQYEITIPRAGGGTATYRTGVDEMGHSSFDLVGERPDEKTGWYDGPDGLFITFNQDGSRDVSGMDSTRTQRDLHVSPTGVVSGTLINDWRNTYTTLVPITSGSLAVTNTADKDRKPTHYAYLDFNGKPTREVVFDEDGDPIAFRKNDDGSTTYERDGYDIQVKDPWRYTVWAPDGSHIDFDDYNGTHKGWDANGNVFADTTNPDRRGTTDKSLWENLVSAGAGLVAFIPELVDFVDTAILPRDGADGSAERYLSQTEHEQMINGLKMLVGAGPAGSPSVASAWGGVFKGLLAVEDFARDDYAYAIPKMTVNVALTVFDGAGLVKSIATAPGKVGSLAKAAPGLAYSAYGLARTAVDTAAMARILRSVDATSLLSAMRSALPFGRLAPDKLVELARTTLPPRKSAGSAAPRLDNEAGTIDNGAAGRSPADRDPSDVDSVSGPRPRIDDDVPAGAPAIVDEASAVVARARVAAANSGRMPPAGSGRGGPTPGAGSGGSGRGAGGGGGGGRGGRGRRWTGDEEGRLFLTYARIAKDVYDRASTAVIDGFKRLDAYELMELDIRRTALFDEAVNFSAAIYRNANGAVVLAFKGTNKMTRDMPQNVRQGLGREAEQYAMAVNLAKRLQRTLGPDAEVTIVGHSLGGGLTAVSSLATGFRAVTFNAAGVHDFQIVNNARRAGRTSRTPDEVRADLETGDQIIRFVVEGDILTDLQNAVGMMPAPLGKQILLSPPKVSSMPWRGVTLHKMDTVIEAVRRYYGL